MFFDNILIGFRSIEVTKINYVDDGFYNTTKKQFFYEFDTILNFDFSKLQNLKKAIFI